MKSEKEKLIARKFSTLEALDQWGSQKPINTDWLFASHRDDKSTV